MSENLALERVRVVKRKRDGTVSTVDIAQPLPLPGDTSTRFIPAGARRERPNRGRIEVVGADELWILCGYLDANQYGPRFGAFRDTEHGSRVPLIG